MKNYIIYDRTLVYMALYLKSIAGVKTIVTQNQYADYYKLVTNSLEAERRVANAFTFSVKSGEPSYNFNMISKEEQERINKTIFYYDPQQHCYHTPFEHRDLYYKSIAVIPQSILPMFQPNGYERALGIEPKENIQVTTKQRSTSSTNSEPGDD